MEVKYNVVHRYKSNIDKTIKEKKEIFNKKLINIILLLENKEMSLKN